MESQTSTRKFASGASYLGAALFALLIILFNTMPQNIVVIAVVAVAFHVVLFPVVAELPSTDWARAAGYGWLVLDIAANIMQVNGVDEHTCTALRYGAHIPAIIWIITSSLKASRIMQVVGFAQALIMGSYSFVAPWAPMWMLYPAMVLLIIWLLLSGRTLSKLSQPVAE
jgi:fatty acid desaturase